MAPQRKKASTKKNPSKRPTKTAGKGKRAKNERAKATAVPTEEQADVDRILKERTRRGKKQYLCSWMDGADPQWVDEHHLEGSPAWREWEYAATDDQELHDPVDVVKDKCAVLKQWMEESKRTTWLLGAGISAPVLPTFRGKGGLWTRNPADTTEVDLPTVEPTAAHRGLVELEKRGHATWVATQNYDNLLTKAGFPSEKLSELHGNIFVETCEECATVYKRDFEVPLEESEDHSTGRTCEQKGCHGRLKDNIVHFDEGLPWKDLSLANAKFVGAELTIAMGSSLHVFPAADLPFKGKRRRRLPPRPRAVIINLQPTPMDDQADLIIRATCDEVIAKLLE